MNLIVLGQQTGSGSELSPIPGILSPVPLTGSIDPEAGIHTADQVAEIMGQDIEDAARRLGELEDDRLIISFYMAGNPSQRLYAPKNQPPTSTSQ